MAFSTRTLMKIALILDEEEERENKDGKRRRRFWVHPLVRARQEEGEYSTLYPHLINDDVKFYKYFRMSHGEYMEILSKIESGLRKEDTPFRKSISPTEKLSVCLRYLATGDSLQTITFSFRMGHSTVHSIVHGVCDSIINQLFAKCIPTPDKEQWEEIAKKFWSVWNFSNCIGALDGKHVQITAPANSGSNYFNYKRTFSVVLLALVDADYRFISVDIGSFGKNSDGGIFANSQLGKALSNGTLDVPGSKQLPGSCVSTPHVIIVDSAFQLKTYMMRPYPQSRQDLTVNKKIYNYRHCRGRRVVENGFGILAQRFRIYFRTIVSKPGYIENIILVTCILHNFLRNNKMSLLENDSCNDSPDQTTIFNNLPSIGINAQNAAFVVREKFTDYFNSKEGSVDWQYRCI